MEEVVYQFLLQSVGYPRAAIVSDTSVVFSVSDAGDRPTYLIVDPKTATPLAVIYVVGAVDAAGLYAASTTADIHAKSLRPNVVQGFVVRIDFKGNTDNEKIQFYQSKDKGELYPLTATTFPDLDSLRVASLLHSNKTPAVPLGAAQSGAAVNASVAEDANELPQFDDSDYDGIRPDKKTKTKGKKRTGFWLGLLLVLLAIADAVSLRVTGEPLLQLTHVLLITGAVLAFLMG